MLYAGLAVFVLLASFTARSIWIAWNARSGEARAGATFDLVGQRMPSRPTDAPGALAWLLRELGRFDTHVSDEARARAYRSLAAPVDRVPAVLEGVLGPMRRAVGAGLREATALPVTLGALEAPGAASLRRQRLLTRGTRALVMTRARRVDLVDAPSSVAAPVAVLSHAHDAIDRALTATPLPAVPGSAPPRAVRVYIVDEAGTLISSPWPSGGDDEATAVRREMLVLGARPLLPTFAPQEFFFRFPVEALAVDLSLAPAAYSGFYLDLGGRGLVSTVMLPVDLDVLGGGRRGVLALDLAFDVDWQAFARVVESPVQGAAVHVANAGTATWATLESLVDRQAAPQLAAAVSALSARASQAGATVESTPLRLGVVDDVGAVAAFQVSDSIWLLMLFPKSAPAFPVAAVGLLAGLLALLFGGFEFHRRRAEDERQRAERALAEKQNLLNTMQVPLVVVDPNTDVIVSANKAAASIGIRAGSRFADLVADDPRARAHYQRMQTASTEPRRAYGIPVTVRDEAGASVSRYALVRSVAVTAPIDALAADERHRLGVLFVVEPDADLAILASDIGDEARRDERRRFAGLLSHGVDTLARVLEHCLSQRTPTTEMREFTAWLADYLERRLTVTGWLLEHWDDGASLPRASVVDEAQVTATIQRMSSVFEYVAGERELRARLHWDNGVLALPSSEGRVLHVAIDWPASFECTCPVRGGVGLFFGEVLANAIRHGRPGTTPRVSVAIDRVRQELVCEVENVIGSGVRSGPSAGESYGGLAILRALARLFQWRDLTVSSTGDAFVVRWRMPVSDRGIAGQAD